MRYFSLAALAVLGASAHAQNAAWFAKRFGLNVVAPDLFPNQTANDYKDFAYNDNNPNARWNTSAAAMTGAGVIRSTSGRAWNDPTLHQWTDIYELTDKMPKNTWVRVAANILNHFPDPYNPTGQRNKERNLDAIIGRIMFRGTDLSNGLNILFNMTPGVYPNAIPADSWSTIRVDPVGRSLTASISTGEPPRRDWWRPQAAYLPYLKTHVQQFVYDMNNAASNIVRARSASGTLTENYVSRIGFQLGNEPAAGHPGGSIDGPVGSWNGVGAVLEGTMAGIDYKTNATTAVKNRVPSGWGTNPLTMPAFSMFSEQVNAYRMNYVMGQLRNIQWGGSIAPGINEIASYPKEMQGMQWPTICGRRALHFNSPTYQWRYNPLGQYSLTSPDGLLTSSLIDPNMGRWETPQEYAKRWVAELTKQVDMVSGLPMPGSSTIVDVTEAYFCGSQSAAGSFNNSFTDANGNPVNLSTMTFDQIRATARANYTYNNKLTPLPQQPASREQILAAIRTELYNQDMAGTLTPNLGRIYWWGASYTDPRNETGLTTDDNNNVTGYNPWGDFRLTMSEVKALWNLP